MSGRCLLNVFGAEYLRKVIFIADTRQPPLEIWVRKSPPASAPPLNTSYPIITSPSPLPSPSPSPSHWLRRRAETWGWGISDNLSGTSDELKSMSLDESTSCNWSIYGGDGRRNDADVDEDWCTRDDVSTIVNTEETDLPIDWSSDGDDADLEGVLIFDDTNYENGSQCDDVVTSMVDKSLQVSLQSLSHEEDRLADMPSDEVGCKCGCGLGRIFGMRRLRRLCRLLRGSLHPRRMSRRHMP